MGIIRCNYGVSLQLQGADEGGLQFCQKVKGASQKCHISADRFAAGKTADGLVYHCLKDGGGEIRF